MYSEIISKIKTTSDFHQIVEEINMLVDSMYETSASKGFNFVLNKIVRAWFSDILKKIFRDANIDRKNYLADLKKALEDIEVMNVNLAFEPSSDFIVNMHDYISFSCDTNIVLDIAYNPQIVGGMTISFKGKYLDLSLEDRFNQAVSEVSW